MTQNIITSVLLDVESSSVSEAKDSVTGMVKELGLGVKAAGAVAAAVGAIAAAFESVEQNVRANTNAAADFSNEIDAATRRQLLGTSEVLDANEAQMQRIRAEGAALDAEAAEWWSGAKLSLAQYDLDVKRFFSFNSQAWADDADNREAANERITAANLVIFNSGLDRQRIALMRFTEGNAAYQLARQEQLLKEQTAAAILAYGDQNEERLQLEIQLTKDTFEVAKQFVEAQEQFKYDTEQARLTKSEKALNNALAVEEAAVLGQNQKLQVLYIQRLDMYRKQLNDGEISLETFHRAAAASAATYNKDISDIAVAAHQEQIDAMTTATNSLLRYADRELQQIFRAMNDLVKLLQSMDVLRGVGGIFGAISPGPGGLGGGGTGSNGGPSGFGGISMGNTYISVAGGNTNADTAKTLDNQLRQTMTAIANQQIGYANQPGGQTFPGIERQR